MNNRRTKRFLLLEGGLTAKTQTFTDNTPRAYLGTPHELGALLHLMAEPRIDPDIKNASRAENCTCGKPWDDCPLKALRGKQHPRGVSFRCRLMRIARQRLDRRATDYAAQLPRIAEISRLRQKRRWGSMRGTGCGSGDC